MTNKISADLFIQNRPDEKAKNNNVMGKDDFLRLLIAQLQNQDPLNPMEDREFISQMANFTSLEQMTNLNKSMEGFISSQNKMNVLSLQAYLGANLTYQNIYEVDGEQFVEEKTGTVERISLQEGKARLVMNDATEIAVEQITKVNQGESTEASANALLSASNLIGKQVSINQDNETIENALVQSVVIKEGKIFLISEDPRLTNRHIPLDAITKISQ
ncbi:Basal-body rod modification protein FlgD [Bacillus sp. THAF10]|uniref:flagellar hook assembly protein FlgD n=1 Tax=Bacillus sp. THAF10 TaxID=2587848 RepID=UPI00126973BD|nr:flagellar hook assembly protein FlgD [Bacillus sp. THAF10]QFT88872.1 Basal-body rod modification protein FlgD [Bacillus sp. THAF10]